MRNLKIDEYNHLMDALRFYINYEEFKVIFNIAVFAKKVFVLY